MRALIVDDEAPARARLRRMLAAAGDVEVVGEASTGREAVAAIRRVQTDVVFLDIQMPGLDGFGVVRELQGDGAPYVVFVTADDQQAVRAFEVGAVDYLLKPYTRERFDQVVARARARLADAGQPRAPAPDTRPAFLTRILVLDDGRAHLLAVDHIDVVQAEGNYVQLSGAAGRVRLRATVGSLEARLDPAHFLRINRSTLVRLDAIRSMHEWSHGDYRVIMADGTEHTWSRRYRAAADTVFGLG